MACGGPINPAKVTCHESFPTGWANNKKDIRPNCHIRALNWMTEPQGFNCPLFMHLSMTEQIDKEGHRNSYKDAQQSRRESFLCSARTEHIKVQMFCICWWLFNFPKRFSVNEIMSYLLFPKWALTNYPKTYASNVIYSIFCVSKLTLIKVKFWYIYWINIRVFTAESIAKVSKTGTCLINFHFNFSFCIESNGWYQTGPKSDWRPNGELWVLIK